MQKYIISLLMITCTFSVVAKTSEFDGVPIRGKVNSQYLFEWSNIFSKNVVEYATGKDGGMIRDLQSCVDHGNYVCATELGKIYLEHKRYSKARDYFIMASDHVDGEHDANLGIMYAEGLGVMQNFDKAIWYAKKAARQGDANSAYNLHLMYCKTALMYDMKTGAGKSRNEHEFIRSIAWLKIATALGLDSFKDEDNKDIPMSKKINKIHSTFAEYGYIEKANRLANEICDEISTCKK